MQGMVSPHNSQIEDYILGAVMVEHKNFEIVSELLQTETFYSDINQKIFSAMKVLAAKNQVIDIMTVIEQCRKDLILDAVGGPYAITKLTNDFTGSVGIESKCRIILEKFISRELIRISAEIQSAAFDGSTDAFELLDLAENKIFQISNKHLNNDYTDLQTALSNAIRKVEELRTKEEHITGVPTGFPSLDRITHGWQSTDLIILAARPSVGKTAFALNLAKNAALNALKPVNVGFFSLEMSTGQLVNRLLACESEVYLDAILTGRLRNDQMTQIYDKGVVGLGKAKIFIDDSAALNSFQLRSKARRMVNKDKVGLIIIDYLQLMTGETKGNREQEISKLSRDLKKMAKELGCPVIALSQLSRDIEKRSNKTPQLSDLRESGAIEQDADLVAFLYRPEDEDLQDTGMLAIKKHRNGSLGDITFNVNNSIQKWSELTTETGNWKPVPKDDNPF
jgi:replicative DNA helicase